MGEAVVVGELLARVTVSLGLFDGVEVDVLPVVAAEVDDRGRVRVVRDDGKDVGAQGRWLGRGAVVDPGDVLPAGSVRDGASGAGVLWCRREHVARAEDVLRRAIAWGMVRSAVEDLRVARSLSAVPEADMTAAGGLAAGLWCPVEESGAPGEPGQYLVALLWADGQTTVTVADWWELPGGPRWVGLPARGQAVARVTHYARALLPVGVPGPASRRGVVWSAGEAGDGPLGHTVTLARHTVEGLVRGVPVLVPTTVPGVPTVYLLPPPGTCASATWEGGVVVPLISAQVLSLAMGRDAVVEVGVRAHRLTLVSPVAVLKDPK